MEIEEKHILDTGLEIKPIGRIDINTAEEFGQTVKAKLDNIKDLVINFEEIIYISSMGLRILLELQKQMEKQGSMRLVNVKAEIKELFSMTGFDKILTVI